MVRRVDAEPLGDCLVHRSDRRLRLRPGFLGPDVALVLSVGGTVMRGKSKPAPARDSIQTLVAVREAGHAGGWSFVSFQNTRIRPIGTGAMSALLWLIPDKLWGLFFRASRTVPRRRPSFPTRGLGHDVRRIV